MGHRHEVVIESLRNLFKARMSSNGGSLGQTQAVRGEGWIEAKASISLVRMRKVKSGWCIPAVQHRHGPEQTAPHGVVWETSGIG
jgi:hypothetical protein